MTQSIKCKVIRIISQTELVIDAGSSQGVEKGMIFAVNGELDIRDPDSGETIEEIPYEKLRVKVSTLGENVSIAETYRRVRTRLAQDILFGEAFAQQELIKTKEITMPRDWDTTISVGDAAVNLTVASSK